MTTPRTAVRWRKALDAVPTQRPANPTRRERQRLSDLILMVTAVALGGGLVAMLLLSLSS
jgi:hypothetical protein